MKKIDTVACLGAGVIGASWAACFAKQGCQVRLYDIKDEFLTDAHGEGIMASVFASAGICPSWRRRATWPRRTWSAPWSASPTPPTLPLP